VGGWQCSGDEETGMRKWSALIIHHTAGNQSQTLNAIRNDQMRRGYGDIAYHFLIQIDKDGRGHLKRGRSDELNGCHGNNHFNRNALGFCIIGNYDKYPPSEELYQDILAGVKHVLNTYRIEPKKVYGHKEIKGLRPGEKVTATACPGSMFPLERLKKDIF
jgi:N-acetylmuramoyl-L-alanine amidase